MKDKTPNYIEPASAGRNQSPKRKDLFFHSDVMDCVDYAECMADEFAQPDRFLKAVIKKLEVSARGSLTHTKSLSRQDIST